MVRWAFVTSTSAVWMHIIGPISIRSYDGRPFQLQKSIGP